MGLPAFIDTLGRETSGIAGVYPNCPAAAGPARHGRLRPHTPLPYYAAGFTVTDHQDARRSGRAWKW